MKTIRGELGSYCFYMNDGDFYEPISSEIDGHKKDYHSVVLGDFSSKNQII